MLLPPFCYRNGLDVDVGGEENGFYVGGWAAWSGGRQ